MNAAVNIVKRLAFSLRLMLRSASLNPALRFQRFAGLDKIRIRGPHLQFDACLREVRALADLQSVHVQVGGAACKVLDRDAAHRDLLHQLLVIGVHRVETVHLGALDLVGC